MYNLGNVSKCIARENTDSTYDTANGKEPDDDCNDLGETSCIFSLHTIDSDLTKKLGADVEVKDCADTNGAEKANKDCLLQFFNLVNPFVEQQNNWKPSEEQDQNT